MPNAVSLMRVPLAAAFVMADRLPLRLTIVAAAAFSDWVDGALARRARRVTRAGELLDPVADRVFMVAALVSLAVEHQFPLWTLPLLLLRDIGVVCGGLVVLALNRRARLPARTAGKRLTWLQFIAVGVLLLWPKLVIWLVAPIAVLGLAALADYARQARLALYDR